MKISELFIKLRKRLSGSYAGQFRSNLQWSGIEIADSRKYTAGDAKKFINRKQSAKHNDLYVSLLDQDSDVQVDVFCDINYNWQWGIDQPNSDKVFAYLADLVLFAHGQGMRLVVYYPHDGLKSLPVVRLDDWYGIQQSLYSLVSLQKPIYQSSLSLFLDQMVQTKKRRVILVVSDFLSLSPTDRDRLRWLEKDHQVLCVRIGIDRWEGINYIGSDIKNVPMDVYDL
jgi:uncharacterized protein (DUF58 family)